MNVVISHSIRKKEFKHGVIPSDDLQLILDSYAGGIYVSIKGEALPKGSRLVKLYVTSVAGAKRIAFLVDVETGTGFLLFFRGKNDKLGKNISIKNPEFKERLHKYLDLLKRDIEAGQINVYEVNR